jgi:poly(3-hydroxybutyrate) depolymerase
MIMNPTYPKLAFLLLFFARSLYAGDVTIIDTKHYSNVLGEIRNYRVFLPPDYYNQPEKRYPVIYYCHGWSQRYFGSTSHSSIGIDKGTDNNSDNIENFVRNHDVIVVKPDGYNRSPDEEYYLRPWNVSPVETNRQFPIYFPELVDHIDAYYRTIPDRGHRAITGLSMGGFMTFWIGGKYPHLLSAAGNFCGSTEFFVGPKNFPVEYRHIDMFKNYEGMNVRLHYGNEDFIRGYHQDMNRVWTQVMDNYEYKIYEAAHSTCGLADMFEFILETFKNPPAKPTKWHHTDVYPDFTVWDYKIQTDRNMPGFTVLENVDQRGFRSAIREFLPDGPLMPFVQMAVTTPPLYEANEPYIIHDLDPASSKKGKSVIYSDHTGRLKIPLNGGYHEIGINRAKGMPNLTLLSYSISNMDWATPNKDVSLSMKLLNKGSALAKGVKASLFPVNNSTMVRQDQSGFRSIAINETMDSEELFIFKIQNNQAIDMVQFKLVITDKHGNEWIEFFEIPIRTDSPEISSFEIADGKQFTVAAAGNDSISVFLGRGNGDGVANPGESIVILVKDRGIFHRTFLYTDNNFINPNEINIRESDNWGSYDHVGGSAKYSVPVIASNCPNDHEVSFFAEYWLPDYPYHIIKQGKVKLKVSGQDHTPPAVQWVRVSGNNTIQVKVYDGGEIQSATAKLKTEDNPEAALKVVLNDQGEHGDVAKGDHVFSYKISEQKFGLYQAEIEATDEFGNTMTMDWFGDFVLY